MCWRGSDIGAPPTYEPDHGRFALRTRDLTMIQHNR